MLKQGNGGKSHFTGFDYSCIHDPDYYLLSQNAVVSNPGSIFLSPAKRNLPYFDKYTLNQYPSGIIKVITLLIIF
jgi:hypothetical protein